MNKWGPSNANQPWRSWLCSFHYNNQLPQTATELTEVARAARDMSEFAATKVCPTFKSLIKIRIESTWPCHRNTVNLGKEKQDQLWWKVITGVNSLWKMQIIMWMLLQNKKFKPKKNFASCIKFWYSGLVW
jgi:hypothetical protein